MSVQRDAFVLGGTQISLAALGVSVFPTKIIPPSGCIGMNVQYISGGSAVICPNAISGVTIGGATVPANILGFLVPVSAGIEINGPAYFYMACGSSTAALIGLNFYFSSGGATLS